MRRGGGTKNCCPVSTEIPQKCKGDKNSERDPKLLSCSLSLPPPPSLPLSSVVRVSKPRRTHTHVPRCHNTHTGLKPCGCWHTLSGCCWSPPSRSLFTHSVTHTLPSLSHTHRGRKHTQHMQPHPSPSLPHPAPLSGQPRPDTHAQGAHYFGWRNVGFVHEKLRKLWENWNRR